jgi:hypothetical protein
MSYTNFGCWAKYQQEPRRFIALCRQLVLSGMAKRSCLNRSKIYFVVSTYFCTWGLFLLLLFLDTVYILCRSGTSYHWSVLVSYTPSLQTIFTCFLSFWCFPIYRLLVGCHINLFLITFILMLLAVSSFSYILFTWPNYFSRFPLTLGINFGSQVLQ